MLKAKVTAQTMRSVNYIEESEDGTGDDDDNEEQSTADSRTGKQNRKHGRIDERQRLQSNE